MNLTNIGKSVRDHAMISIYYIHEQYSFTPSFYNFVYDYINREIRRGVTVSVQKVQEQVIKKVV